MLDFPAGMKLRRRMKDKIWRVEAAVFVAGGLILLFWGLAHVWPGLGIGGWLRFPMPGILAESGLFIPLHIFMFIWWARAERDAKKYRGPMLITEDGHYAIDERHGGHFEGEWSIFFLGGMPTDKPGTGFHDEGIGVVRHTIIKPKLKDYHAPVRLVPVSMDQLPPSAYRWLTAKGIAEGEFFSLGFTVIELAEDELGRSHAQAIVDVNAAQNRAWKAQQNAHKAMVNYTDSMAAVAQRTREAIDRAPLRRLAPSTGDLQGPYDGSMIIVDDKTR